ncbi:hypothetical protein ABZY83_13815, partial [Streptomyces virginiae]
MSDTQGSHRRGAPLPEAYGGETPAWPSWPADPWSGDAGAADPWSGDPGAGDPAAVDAWPGGPGTGDPGPGDLVPADAGPSSWDTEPAVPLPAPRAEDRRAGRRRRAAEPG